MKGETARKLAALWQHSGDALLLADAETRRILDANPSAETLFGHSAAVLKQRTIADLHPPEQAEEVQQAFAAGVAQPGVSDCFDIVRADGSRLPVEIRTGSFIGDGGRLVGIGSFRDISQRVRAENDTRRLNWALTAVNRAAFALASAGSEADMMRLLCEGLTGDGFVLSWVGLAQDDAARSISVAAKAGSAQGYLDRLELSWADVANGRGPTGLAIRHNRTEVNNDIQTNSAFAPWAERARAFQIRSSMSTPLLRQGRPFGALTIYSHQVNAFTPQVVRLFEDLGRELVVGLDAKRLLLAYELEARKFLEEKLKYKAVLEQAIAALATTIAKRDPYTAEHQKKVANYAVDISLKLGWDLDRCESVYMAGLVHDIGKINVPSEILNRPGRLIPAEFELVKLHPLTGYDILVGIDFPWKIAEITRQHHERLDGSGYPDGLKGEAIMPEAQVIAVADIFDAMSSHRPYRPTLGHKAALAELQRLRGHQLDATIVDAALEVFQR